MTSMFSMCFGLSSLDINNFDTSRVTEWNTDRVTDSNCMFLSCKSLVGGNGTEYRAAHIDKEYARIDAPGVPGYLTLKEDPDIPAQQAAPCLLSKYTPNGKLGISVTWPADPKAQGYAVPYCQNSDFTGVTLHSAAYAGKTECFLTTCPQFGETWYVRVRAYIKNGSGIKDGAWSDTASILVK